MIMAVHNDHEHMHCHIVFNSVGRLDGSKYRYVDGDWEKYIQPLTDSLALKHGLSKLEYEKGRKKGTSYAEHAAEKSGKFTWKKIIRLDIDMAVSNSETLEGYFSERSGWVTKSASVIRKNMENMRHTIIRP